MIRQFVPANLCALLAVTIITAASACSESAPSQRVVEIKTADGTILKGTLFSASKPGPAVLLLHQCDEQRKVWDSLGVRLMKNGISALSVDYRGYGESGGSPYLKLSPQEQTRMSSEVWPPDIDTAFAFLSRQQNVDTARMAAGGGSCGVDNAITVAQHHHNVKALALLAGGTTHDGREFLASPNAPPIFTAAAAADDKYANFVDIMSWYRGVSPQSSSRAITYRDGGHAAVVFKMHPDYADSIAKWYAAVLFNKSELLPTTNGIGMNADVLKVLHDLDQAGGSARVHSQLATLRTQNPVAQLFPEYFANQLGYEHLLQLHDTTGAVEIMKLNTVAYPASPNAMDSLGDIYVAMGNKPAALECARKTIALLDKDTIDTPDRIKNIRDAAQGKIRTFGAK